VRSLVVCYVYGGNLRIVNFYVCSMDAYKAVKEKDARLLDLQRRRKQLAALLAEEREQLHVSLYLLKL